MTDSPLFRMRELYHESLDADATLLSLDYHPEHAQELARVILEIFPTGLPDPVYFYCKNIQNLHDNPPEQVRRYYNEFMNKIHLIEKAGSLHHAFSLLGGKVNEEYIMGLVDRLDPSSSTRDVNDVLIAIPAGDIMLKKRVFRGIKTRTSMGIVEIRTQYNRLMENEIDSDPIEEVVDIINNNPRPFKFVEYRDDNGFFVRKLEGCLYEREVKGELEVMIDLALDQIDPALSRASRRSEIIQRLRLKNYVSRKDHEPRRDIIIFKNGVYNLKTWTFTPFGDTTEEAISFTWIPHEYHSLSPEVPAFDEFLKQVLVSDTQIQCWWEWMGYCLTRWVGYKKAAIFHGPIDSGKTTLSKVMKHVIGKQNQAGTSFHRIFEDRFANSTLMDRQWNYDDDIGKQRITETANFKRLVGFEDMDVEIKGQTSFLYHNIIKIQGCCNSIPYIPEPDVIGPKLLILRFPNQFPKQDGFVDRFLTPEITGYIITRSLHELHDRVTRGYFAGMTDQDAIDYLRKETDPVYGFLNDCCTLGVEARFSTDQADVFSAFLEWADLHGKEVGYITNKRNDNESKKIFTRKIHALGFTTSRPGSGTDRRRVYTGVQLNDDWKDQSIELRYDVDEIQLTANSIVKRKQEHNNTVQAVETMKDTIKNGNLETIKDLLMDIPGVELLPRADLIRIFRIKHGDRFPPELLGEAITWLESDGIRNP